MNSSWKTTVGGLLTAIGGVLLMKHEPAWLLTVGQILSVCGPILLGASAADHSNLPPPPPSNPVTP